MAIAMHTEISIAMHSTVQMKLRIWATIIIISQCKELYSNQISYIRQQTQGANILIIKSPSLIGVCVWTSCCQRLSRPVLWIESVSVT